MNVSDDTKPHGPRPQGPRARLYLTTADASRVLEVTPATVRLMVRRGDLRARAWTESGVHLFHREDVERLARKRIRRGLSRRARAEGR